MGSYNPQYRDYYSSIADKKKNYYGSSSSSSKNKKGNNENFFIRRITRDLIGVLVLLIFVLSCKMIVTPSTKTVYNYSKKIVNENYDYKKALKKVKGFDFEKVKELDFSKIKSSSEDFIEKTMNKFNGAKPIKQVVKEEYVMPCSGTVTSEFGERKDPFTGKKRVHKGIDISVQENTPVAVCNGGKIKECGVDKELGKYIVVDHGKGIETKYAHLNEISVKKDQIVKRGFVIGKSGNTGKSTGPHLHFEIMYMGESKNPRQFFKIK